MSKGETTFCNTSFPVWSKTSTLVFNPRQSLQSIVKEPDVGLGNKFNDSDSIVKISVVPEGVNSHQSFLKASVLVYPVPTYPFPFTFTTTGAIITPPPKRGMLVQVFVFGSYFLQDDVPVKFGKLIPPKI